MKFIIILLLPFFFSCQNTSSRVESKDTTTAKKLTDTLPSTELAGNFSPQTEMRFDSTIVPSFLARFPTFKKYQEDFTRFYSSRKYAYAWHQPDGRPIEQSSILYNLVFHIDENGLPVDIPYPDAYTKLMEDGSADSMLSRELMITGQYLVYADKVLAGIPETDTKSINWYIPRKKVEYGSLLDSILSGKTLEIGKFIFPQCGDKEIYS